MFCNMLHSLCTFVVVKINIKRFLWPGVITSNGIDVEKSSLSNAALFCIS